jgi:hypothetical protein
MIALLTYPPGIEPTVLSRTKDRSFSHRIWQLHGIIANPTSQATDVKYAKRSMLRTLTAPRQSSPDSASVVTALRFNGKSNNGSAGATKEKALLRMAPSRREDAS